MFILYNPMGYVAMVIAVSSMVCGMPTEKPMDQSGAMNYFKKYGYFGKGNPDPKVAALTDSDGYPIAIRSFQTMHGLPVTGVLDEETRKLMEMKRCGNKDVINMEDNSMSMTRKKRYAIEGSKWPNNQLTYKITRYTPDLTKSEVDREIRRAFSAWEMVTPLRFTQRGPNERVDITILFASGSHGDGNPFDGQGKTLAHAYFPQYGGDSHFDESEMWTINTNRGINLFQVAAHEFGHALGLFHSNINDALMAPFYRGYQANFMLHQDDIDGIQKIYGRPTTTTPTTTTQSTTRGTGRPRTTTSIPRTIPTTTPTISIPDLKIVCDTGKFDAITNHYINGQLRTFAFYKNLYMLLDGNGIAPGYPKKIRDGWSGLENNIDTALTLKEQYSTFWSWNGRWQLVTKKVAPTRTYFFKGDKYWRFENGQMKSGYPKSITSKWGLPSGLDAAFIWSYNGRAYFVKGSQYYRLNQHNNGVDNGYPRPLAVWDPSLTSVRAAVQYSPNTYFFIGNQYYKYDDRNFALSTGYPRSISQEWMGCDRFDTLLLDVNSAPVITTTTLLISTIVTVVMSTFILQ